MKAKTTPIIKINHKLFSNKNVEVFIKLDYMRHPEVQGNKWHKLNLNVKEALKQGKSTLLTFGGAYSNHIASTAAMAKSMHLKSIGLIRGDELANNPKKWSHTLQKAHQQGMAFIFLNRQEYRTKHTTLFLDKLTKQYPDAFIIPEGGSNQLAIDGFKAFMHETNQQLPDWTHLMTPVGTGGTLAGITKYANHGQSHVHTINTKQKQVIGVAVLKDADYLKAQIKSWINSTEPSLTHSTSSNLSKTTDLTSANKLTSPEPIGVNWQLLTQYHHGGYAKQSDELMTFSHWFENHFSIPLDPIYTNKMLYAFFRELEQDRYPPGAKVLLVHTGGLQGRPPLK